MYIERVPDRGMPAAARIREDCRGVAGLRRTAALRAPTMRKLLRAGTVTQALFDERDLARPDQEATSLAAVAPADIFLDRNAPPGTGNSLALRLVRGLPSGFSIPAARALRDAC